ncbi:MAG: tol-pal system protein YbgF [Betaproteobacteria bacterium]|nr:tol-pal system protein YbgF [Betaproteobacteria bacterium]
MSNRRKQLPFLAPGLPGALFGLLLIAFGAQAGIFNDDEARQGVADLRVQQEALKKQQQTLDERVTRMESVLQSYPDTVNKLDALNQDQAQLRGKLDVLGNQIDTVDKHIHELYLDLDSRLKLLETAAAKAAAPADATATPTEAEAVPSPSYVSALAAFNSGDYASSRKQFEAFLKANPKDPKAVNALYWLGVNQLSLKDYKGARATNQELFKTHPESEKAPDALLNLASALTELGDAVGAKATLKMLLAKYPKSPAAVKAKARLQER